MKAMHVMEVPADLTRILFYAMCNLKEQHCILCMGVESASGGKSVANPPKGYVMAEDDHLIVIASQRRICEDHC